jgi:uncharacterized membrane protein (TIGR02234 family)
MPVKRREFALVLLLGAAGSGLVVLATRQAWAQAIFVAPHPLPAQDFSVTGQALVPLASALALAALACLAAVIATRSGLRRAVGVLLALLGTGAAAAASAVRASAVITAARESASSGALGGSTTSGTSPGGASHAVVIVGSSGHVVMAGAPWRAVAVIGAVAIIGAGLATAVRGPRWPVMSARFDRSPAGSGGVAPPGREGSRGDTRLQHSSATMWESLSQDIDPTLESELDGGTRG